MQCLKRICEMRKIIGFSKKRGRIGDVNLDLLNEQILQIENDGWKVISVTPNCSFLECIHSYTLLVELS
jgi:hypothetical protein